MIKKLTKGIEESKKEKERLISEKEALTSTFKEIEVKAFTVQENYKKTQEVYIYLNPLSERYGLETRLLIYLLFPDSAANGSTQNCAR